jgi:competence protein ComEC
MKESFQKYGLFYLFLFLLFFVIVLFYLTSIKRETNLTFAMLDVGQGDSLFIESPSGMQILIDGGRDKKTLSELSRLMPFYDKSIDMLIITNPDLDHIGGFLDILKNYKVDVVLEPGTYNDSTIYKSIENIIKEKNVKRILARAGMKIDIGGGAYIEILFPDRDVSIWDNNDGSIVVRLVYGESTIMLTGDATIKTEEIILKNFQPKYLESDILKIGHHGSNTSTSEAFVKTVNPKYALISSGKKNNYGHPHKEVLDILEAFGVEILRTDTLGTIVFTCDRIKECKIKK